VRWLLVTASVVPSSPILVTLMKEVLRSSETSVLTRATRRNIPEDAILHSHRRETPKSLFNFLATNPFLTKNFPEIWIRELNSVALLNSVIHHFVNLELDSVTD
jgi:hypothetical protein